jgi:hypothetical protein
VAQSDSTAWKEEVRADRQGPHGGDRIEKRRTTRVRKPEEETYFAEGDRLD